jgi:hypothetical protein
MIGPTEAGKSSHRNRLLRTEAFRTDTGIQSETSETTTRESKITGTDGSPHQYCIIDAPGVGDTAGRDGEFIPRIVRFFQGLTTAVNWIAYVIPFGMCCSTDGQKTFKLLHALFGNKDKLWDHRCLVVTKCSYKDRKSWVDGTQEQLRQWKEAMKRLRRECSGDHNLNYGIAVFFLDTTLRILSNPYNEANLFKEPEVVEWSRQAAEQTISSFRGWRNILIKDKKLHACYSPRDTRSIAIPSRGGL